jgi:membrane protease YdiL (CAAX protease family)
MVIAFLPAIMEEVFFRGLVLKTLQTVSGGHAAVWISALLFSALHFQAFGFVGRTLLGAIFGYMTLLSGGSLWPAICAHFVNNAAFVVTAYFWGLSEANSGVHWVAAAISAIAVVGLLLFWKTRFNKAE